MRVKSACKLTLEEWDAHYAQLHRAGLREPAYGGPLGRHVLLEKDLRLRRLRFDNSPAALRLWNFLLTENRRLAEARTQGAKLVGTMKDLGTVPVIAYALPQVRAFYPDGAWWTPCLMECSDGLLQQAERLGLDASFCPVRAMVPAFLNGEHFPRPDLLLCSTGAVCDDFSAIAQRLERLGFPITWWEMPRRRSPEPHEVACLLPGGLQAPQTQVDCVRGELERLTQTLCELAGGRIRALSPPGAPASLPACARHQNAGKDAGAPGATGVVRGQCANAPLAGQTVDATVLAEGIRKANQVRRLLAALRHTVYGAAAAPLPSLELLVAEMLAIHFCSDREETAAVLAELLAEAEARLRSRQFVLPAGAVRVFWVNPVADLRALNLLEDWGGRVCGSDYMFTHALDLIPEDLPPLEALARTALADPMAGSARDRARRIVADCRAFQAEAVVISRIPGASHCAQEGALIRQVIQEELGLPSIELEIPPICDSFLPTLGSRVQALLETAREKRNVK